MRTHRLVGEWLATVGSIACGLAVLMGQSSVPVDTPSTRLAAAEQYLKAVPVEDEIYRLIEEISAQVALDRRDAYVSNMKQQIDMVYMRSVMLDGLTAEMTTAELQAAARFFGSPIGQSVRDKLPKVIDRVMPQIQAELARKAQRLSH